MEHINMMSKNRILFLKNHAVVIGQKYMMAPPQNQTIGRAKVAVVGLVKQTEQCFDGATEQQCLHLYQPIIN